MSKFMTVKRLTAIITRSVVEVSPYKDISEGIRTIKPKYSSFGQ